MHDYFWLYNGPQCPNAVQWSLDNQLGAAAAHTVTILAPGHLDGPRSSACAPITSSTEPLVVDGTPEDLESSAQLVLAVAGEVKAGEPPGSVNRNYVRNISWSPPGCTPQAGCYLAMVTADSKVGT